MLERKEGGEDWTGRREVMVGKGRREVIVGKGGGRYVVGKGGGRYSMWLEREEGDDG
jgi:hypothetical protein